MCALCAGHTAAVLSARRSTGRALSSPGYVQPVACRGPCAGRMCLGAVPASSAQCSTHSRVRRSALPRFSAHQGRYRPRRDAPHSSAPCRERLTVTRAASPPLQLLLARACLWQRQLPQGTTPVPSTTARTARKGYRGSTSHRRCIKPRRVPGKRPGPQAELYSCSAEGLPEVPARQRRVWVALLPGAQDRLAPRPGDGVRCVSSADSAENPTPAPGPTKEDRGPTKEDRC